MKNPEYYIGNDKEDEWFDFDEVIDAIEEAQRDAYNNAIVEAIESIMVTDGNALKIYNNQSLILKILKLKKE